MAERFVRLKDSSIAVCLDTSEPDAQVCQKGREIWQYWAVEDRRRMYVDSSWQS